MTKQYSDCLQRYQLPEFPAEWGAIQRGIEKESLRVNKDGQISQAKHPEALGSALTNPFITTDFSEALLEFITPVHEDIDACLQELEDIHRFTLQQLPDDELLWIASMPCPLNADAIPIARYGSSNIGQMKTLYRKGLTLRYGSLMQVISGIHYNFSMPNSFWAPYQAVRGHEGSLQEFRTDSYLHLIRNFHRYSWLLIYLFGASPAACKCFAQGRQHSLQDYDDCSLYLPDATCLRMGNLGYKSEAQESLFVCYNELETYIECLHEAIHTPYADYARLGQKNADGAYQQINTNLLQLENEFYSTIRPKPNLQSGERPLDALRSSGIEYIEVRALDLNPYLPLGIDAEQIRFLDTFLLHCLLADSPVCDQREFFEVSSNISKVVEQGRNPALVLNEAAEQRTLTDWAGSLLMDMEHCAVLLDSIDGGEAHQTSLARQQAKLADPSLTPSGRMLKDMQEAGTSFFNIAMRESRKQCQTLAKGELDANTAERLRSAAAESIAKQAEVEAADEISFDEFLQQWNDR